MNQTLFVLCSMAVGCASGGQSFDDGSGDLGKHNHSDQGPRRPLSELRSLRITSSPNTEGNRLANLVAQGSVSFVGDLDADGRADFVVADPDGEKLNAYVFYGRSEFPEQLELQDADFEITGLHGVAPVGDFNGDGFDDFAFVTVKKDVVFGDATLLLGRKDRRTGIIEANTIETVVSGPTRRPIAGLMAPGDVNGDGFADLVIASNSDPTQLVFGSAQPAWQTQNGGTRVNLDPLMPEEKLWRDPAGDLDGDGIADLLVIGIRGTALYYGRSDGWDTSSAVMAPDASFNGMMRGFGDWDGDGYADLNASAERSLRRAPLRTASTPSMWCSRAAT